MTTTIDTLKSQGRRLAGYGAAAKGVILLNYLGLDASDVAFVVDRNTHKQGLFMPGVHIPVLHPDDLLKQMPDDTLILPWNFQDEIVFYDVFDFLRRVRHWIDMDRGPDDIHNLLKLSADGGCGMESSVPAFDLQLHANST